MARVEVRAVPVGVSDRRALDGSLGLVSLDERRDGVDVKPLDLLVYREGCQEDLLGLRLGGAHRAGWGSNNIQREHRAGRE